MEQNIDIEIQREFFKILEEEYFLELKKQIMGLNNDDTKFLLLSAYKSLENSRELLKNKSLVDAMILIRTAFETSMLAMTFSINSYIKTSWRYLEVSKRKKIEFYNSGKKEDPIAPKNIRKFIFDHKDDLFYKFADSDDFESELSQFYEIGSYYVHPLSIKLIYSKMEYEKNISNYIEKLFQLNIYYIIIMILDFLNKNKNDKIEWIYDAYIFLYGIFNLPENKLTKQEKNTLRHYNMILDLTANAQIIDRSRNELKECSKDLRECSDCFTKDNITAILEKMNRESNIISKLEQFINKK